MSLSSVLAGDLGPSMQIRDYTVNEVVAEGLPLSASLGLAALAWTLVLGIPFGALAAMRRGRWTDRILMGFAALGMSIPNFVLAGLLMIPLVFETHLFPPAGYGTLRALVLPSFCLGLPFAAQVARLTRTGLLDVLGSDWIRTARAKGLSPRAVVLRHGFRGALTPVITFLGPALAGILTGSLVIERIFAIPGIGTHFVQSALERDYTLAMGMVLVYSLILYVLNWLVDLAHAALDPRVRLA
jgi:oligopeptide transport system permease protein